MSNKSQDVVTGYLQQQMLIAMPAMADPNFSRSVTLLCQHNEEGAIGITINRLSGFTLGEILKQLDIDCEHKEISSMLVLEGGPVSPDHGFVLHPPEEGFESSIRINDDIMVTTSRDILAAIATGNGPQQFLVALGYAGCTGSAGMPDGNKRARPQGTLLAFDFGHRRIGVAVGQTLTGTASALAVVRNAREVDWQAIAKIVKEWRPAALIVGLPLGLDGNETDMSRDAREFGASLEEQFKVSVQFEDERLTSVGADERFAEARARGSMRRKDAALKDAMAAQIILENWLQSAH
jgi:putative transcription antitermination factor YqgF